MAAYRGERTKLVIGGASAEVSLIKSSAQPREAKYETRRVRKPNGLVPTDVVVDDAAQMDEGALKAVHAFESGDMVLLDFSKSEARKTTRAEFVARAMDAAKRGDVTFASSGAMPVADVDPKGDAELLDPLAAEDYPDQPEGDESWRDAFAQRAEPEYEVRRGVTLETGEFVDLTDQLAAIDESTKLSGMEVLWTVPGLSVPRLKVRDAQYVAPAGEGAPRMLAHFWQGLRRSGTAALAVRTVKTQQALGALVAAGRETRDAHLVLFHLEWESNVRPVPPRCKLAVDAVPEAAARAAAEAMTEYRTGPKVYEQLRDERMAQRADLFTAAREGRAWEPPEPNRADGSAPARALGAV